MQAVKEKIMEEYLPEVRKMWRMSDTTFPDFLEPVSAAQREKNEEYLRQNLQSLKKLTRSSQKKSLSEKQREMLEQKIESILEQETILNIHEAMSRETMRAFKSGIKDFLKRAREFAPELAMDGIGQAVRNYVVHAVFNELHGCPQVCSNASFGYSMLYPVTDNYIDDETKTYAEKKAYNQLIRDKITGDVVTEPDEYGKKTCSLLQEIKEQYPGEQGTVIAALLLMMLDAQEQSMEQQKGSRQMDAEERLAVSTYKGGMSVLIDRYLVPCEMTQEDYEFYLGFGLYLQLADDLQDITEDAKNDGKTLFTLNLESGAEEQMVNRLFHFLHTLFEKNRSANQSMKEFLLKSCYQLIITSAMGSGEHFSEEYSKQLEACMPVSYEAMIQMKQDFSENRGGFSQDSYLGMLDAMLA